MTAYTEVLVGTWGARAERDGLEGVSNPLANLGNQPVATGTEAVLIGARDVDREERLCGGPDERDRALLRLHHPRLGDELLAEDGPRDAAHDGGSDSAFAPAEPRRACACQTGSKPSSSLSSSSSRSSSSRTSSSSSAVSSSSRPS